MFTHDRRRKLDSATSMICLQRYAFDQYTLDSLSDHNHGMSALGFADISSKMSSVSELYTLFGDYTIEVLGGITKLASTLNREDWQGERNGFAVLSRDWPNQTLLSVHMYSSKLAYRWSCSWLYTPYTDSTPTCT
ncbi:BFH_collapsed_G0047180.mRNA.1.CDS.1 [Saccharomyces cerevisiae]|nr:BFH_collapsed_G0047180.mRNA.1.CDS.1 [Saccharomyces cerevisiae]